MANPASPPSNSATSGKPCKVLVTGASGFIGTHLVDLLLTLGYAVLNVDVVKPATRHAGSWSECSILDGPKLTRVCQDFAPRYMVHLAAYASMEAKSLDEFRVNLDGTRNVLAAAAVCGPLERVVVTSSQHVRSPGSGDPKHDTDFVPLGFYGESKVWTERITREAGLNCAWTIIRPTAVWGPNQPPLADGLWRLLHRGLYVHPSNDPVLRSYGYVKNVVWQIERLLHAPVEAVKGRVFYVGDANIRQQDWINRFSVALAGRPARTVPLRLIRTLSVVGDCLRAVGLSFPIYRSRLSNLTTSNPVPIEPTLELLGQPPYTLDEGVRETAEWLRHYYRGTQPPPEH